MLLSVFILYTYIISVQFSYLHENYNTLYIMTNTSILVFYLKIENLKNKQS